VAHRNNGTNRDVVEALHSSRPPPNPAVCIASIEAPYQRRADVLLGFLHLACALLCLKAQSPSEA
jgi:hypothetical protein